MKNVKKNMAPNVLAGRKFSPEFVARIAELFIIPSL